MSTGNGKRVEVTIVGGGMITNDLILPAVYHLQRTGVVGDIRICALNTPPLKALKESTVIQQAFPGQDFAPYPALEERPDRNFPELYKQVLAEMPPRSAVIVAMPDHLHYAVNMEALKNGHHILCVKPLVLRYDEAVEIETLARDKGLFVGVEYHKRFDTRALMAKRHYAQGHFGEVHHGRG